MKYLEVKFFIDGNDESADLLPSMLGDIGFEAFENSGNILKGYIQRQLFSEEQLNEIVSDFPFPDTKITFTVCDVEDKNWNQTWEDEGFQPIMIGKQCVIHDGRHLPDRLFPVQIEIDARQAFGTGTHETTRLMICRLLQENLHGKRVLDCGCGTGILSIAAAKSGADSITAYDIDEWSVNNTRHNAILNHVDSLICVHHGDVSVLDHIPGTFDLIMANINRNILLNDMPAIRKKLGNGSKLLLSGFYEEDIAMLNAKASSLQMELTGTMTDNHWAMAAFRAME
ncbi:MAG: 50S ribosomal protein L11 methyltransferase [Prevotella sp.]